MKFYHVTDAKNLTSIKRKGLIRKSPKDKRPIFAWKSKELARDYVIDTRLDEEDKGDKITKRFALLEITASKFIPDTTDKGLAVRIPFDIPRSQIRLLEIR